MIRKTIIVLDIIALILTGVWILYNMVRGLSNSDILFSYMYSIVILISFILTLIDQKR